MESSVIFMNLPQLDYKKIMVFVAFIIVYVGIQILIMRGIEVPNEFTMILSTLGAAIAGLLTNPTNGE